ncbi:type II toxin-antitoxin system VapC family toxin [Algiphilus sp. W345]|uniref:Type II toxin-antitoxin system VapC family toxin n=1 Tax=Banduia mediterranea TaxID=3075609 RepID=A0ABU2WFP9_9GAMM|nr:type II toxin-antitoxin system VapC family toxin [Algiphilus sp. W345]MDT0496119.1 type II toxin-antitoxin system VapC family toxin [Algiphilus sp. W345]
MEKRVSQHIGLVPAKDVVDFETACQIQHQAENLMAGGEYEIDSLSVLSVAAKHGCSAYDSEFVALAQSLGKLLVTSDRKLLRIFPGLAATARDCCAGAT